MLKYFSPRSNILMNNGKLDFINSIFKKYILNQKQFQRVADKCIPIDGGEGRCVCEFTVEESDENLLGNLHSGLTATLVDTISSVASLTKNPSHIGTSVDMNISFLKPIKRGETIIIDAVVLQMDKTFAFTQVDFMKKEDNSLVATARHTKTYPKENNVSARL